MSTVKIGTECKREDLDKRGCLTWVFRDGDRAYAVSCSHVMAPRACSPKRGDPVILDGVRAELHGRTLLGTRQSLPDRPGGRRSDVAREDTREDALLDEGSLLEDGESAEEEQEEADPVPGEARRRPLAGGAPAPLESRKSVKNVRVEVGIAQTHVEGIWPDGRPLLEGPGFPGAPGPYEVFVPRSARPLVAREAMPLPSVVVQFDGDRVEYVSQLELDVDVQPGDSGAPVRDANGRIAGMVVAQRGSSGRAVCTPWSRVREEIERLVRKAVAHPDNLAE